MKRLIPLAVLALAASASAQDPRSAPGFGGGITPIGNPSALIASESAFARLAREKGQWTAFAATATDEAEMFVPQRTLAKAWLKGRANPPQAVQWQPSSVWMSCDGSAGVTFGGYQAGSANGWFSTVWQRQKKKGDYKWVLDQGGDLTAPLAGADFITGKVADCVPRPRRNPLADEPPPPPKLPKGTPPPMRPLPGPIPPLAAVPGVDSKDGRSIDGTLVWRSTVLPGGTREWTVWMWQDGKMNEVLKRTEVAKNEG
ncbi:hypothetical protein NSE01_13860 [Novosphingobium sediminis]|uniref:DUF4440 domain-containing protein n=1 Tax=Novosphingobium sediminis TaxID=707214 RepID=A0A512AIP4_9SPHN|nr:hypothetical protein [Novosphingobium sediminis]GEN99553.1 hypothetical protein NSE01_13860 [Novosphingobium sediminis]